MELPFEKTVCRFWKQKLYTLVNREETQELRLPDSMPDIGRVIGCWGQVILRSKEWRTGSLGISGGVMVWVLYAPEDGGTPQRIEGWIPFQSRVDLPEGGEDGTIRVEPVLRSVDARNISSRKLMLRAGIGLLVQALAPEQEELYTPGQVPPDIEVLEQSYPMFLTRETGEKTFLVEETVDLPGGMPRPERMVYYRMSPEIQEQKVLGSRAAFRGIGNLHILYLDESGKLNSYDFEVPFAQYTDLDQEYEPGAEISCIPCITSLEVDLEDGGGIRLKCGLVSQYIINAPSVIRILADAYSPCRKVELEQQEMILPSWLENLQEMLELMQTLPQEEEPVDQVFLPDLPGMNRQPDGVEVELGGMFQAITQDAEGNYSGRNLRVVHNHPLKTGSDTVAFSRPRGTVKCRKESGSWRMDTRIALDLDSISTQPLRMVTGIRAGEAGTPDPERPSVIIRAVGEDESLWDIAKYCGSTVSAIQRMNKLETEPKEKRLLLIPVI